MVTLDEILKTAKFSAQPDDIKRNLLSLLDKINQVRQASGIPMTVTSGLRTMADHLRIYKEKGITDPAKIPMKSNHLYGRAVDIADPHKELQTWCKANESLLCTIGLWMEDFSATLTWCHFQINAPASGKRWFLP